MKTIKDKWHNLDSNHKLMILANIPLAIIILFLAHPTTGVKVPGNQLVITYIITVMLTWKLNVLKKNIVLPLLILVYPLLIFTKIKAVVVILSYAVTAYLYILDILLLMSLDKKVNLFKTAVILAIVEFLVTIAIYIMYLIIILVFEISPFEGYRLEKVGAFAFAVAIYIVALVPIYIENSNLKKKKKENSNREGKEARNNISEVSDILQLFIEVILPVIMIITMVTMFFSEIKRSIQAHEILPASATVPLTIIISIIIYRLSMPKDKTKHKSIRKIQYICTLILLLLNIITKLFALKLTNNGGATPSLLINDSSIIQDIMYEDVLVEIVISISVLVWYGFQGSKEDIKDSLKNLLITIVIASSIISPIWYIYSKRADIFTIKESEYTKQKEVAKAILKERGEYLEYSRRNSYEEPEDKNKGKDKGEIDKDKDSGRDNYNDVNSENGSKIINWYSEQEYDVSRYSRLIMKDAILALDSDNKFKNKKVVINPDRYELSVIGDEDKVKLKIRYEHQDYYIDLFEYYEAIKKTPAFEECITIDIGVTTLVFRDFNIARKLNDKGKAHELKAHLSFDIYERKEY